MTLSIDVLPAPFGPMIARISWRRISTLISLSALTPPKDRLMPSALSSASPICLPFSMRRAKRIPGPSGRCEIVAPACLRGSSVVSSARPAQDRRRLGDGNGLRRADPEVGLQHALAAVLKGDLGLDMRAVAPAIERLDQRLVALADEAPPHLAGARQLAVVGIELLVQDEEAVDLREGERRLASEIRVDLLDALADQRADAALLA